MDRKQLKKIFERTSRARKEFYLFNIPIRMVHPINISIQDVIEKVKQILPQSFFTAIDEILVGQFTFLDDRQINASYADGAIYVTNKQSSITDMVDDIIHETAHSLEQLYGINIYGDGELEKEFLVRRANLYRILKNQPFRQQIEVPEMSTFINSEYDREFDLYLLGIGYNNIEQLLAQQQLFPTPYSITSLSEYFAIGFELFYLKNKKNKLKSNCPILYKKLSEMEETR